MHFLQESAAGGIAALSFGLAVIVVFNSLATAAGA